MQFIDDGGERGSRVSRVLEFHNSIYSVFLLTADVPRPRTCLRLEMIFKLVVIKYFAFFFFLENVFFIIRNNKLAHFSPSASRVGAFVFSGFELLA